MPSHRGSISNHSGLLVLSDSGDCKFCNLRFGDFQVFATLGTNTHSFPNLICGIPSPWLKRTLQRDFHPATPTCSRYWAPGINVSIWSESDATFRRYAVQPIYRIPLMWKVISTWRVSLRSCNSTNNQYGKTKLGQLIPLITDHVLTCFYSSIYLVFTSCFNCFN